MCLWQGRACWLMNRSPTDLPAGLSIAIGALLIQVLLWHSSLITFSTPQKSEILVMYLSSRPVHLSRSYQVLAFHFTGRRRRNIRNGSVDADPLELGSTDACFQKNTGQLATDSAAALEASLSSVSPQLFTYACVFLFSSLNFDPCCSNLVFRYTW